MQDVPLLGDDAGRPGRRGLGLSRDLGSRERSRAERRGDPPDRLTEAASGLYHKPQPFLVRPQQLVKSPA